MKKQIMIFGLIWVVTIVGMFMLFNQANTYPQNSYLGSYDEEISFVRAEKMAFNTDEYGGENTMLSFNVYQKIEVENLEEARLSMKDLMMSFQGYVSGVNGNYEKRKSETITMKIPTENLELFLDSIKSLGNLESDSLSTTDVKNQYDDVSARIESYTIERSRLLDLFESANETSDLVEISSRLSFVEAQLKYYELRQAELEKSVEFATVRILFEEKMTAFSRMIFVELSELFETFSNSFNGALSLLFGAIGFTLPLLILTGMGFGILKLKRKK